MYQATEEHIQLKSTLYKTVNVRTPWLPTRMKNRGEKIEQCNVTQAIRVSLQKMRAIETGEITAIIFYGIHHFKATQAIICSVDSYIDIEIKQVRHTTCDDIQKHEMLKSNLDQFEAVEKEIDHINFSGHPMKTKRIEQADPVTILEWKKLCIK